MATYIVLVNFTEQGVRNIKESADRSAALSATAGKMGITIKDIFWTSGIYDGVLIFEAGDEETAAAWGLHIGSLGNVRTTSLRAFSRSEMESIIAKLP